MNQGSAKAASLANTMFLFAAFASGAHVYFAGVTTPVAAQESASEGAAKS